MECEICGRETTRTRSIELEGAEYIVCGGCAHLGREVSYKNHPRQEKKPFTVKAKPRKNETEEGTELIENYGTVIRKQREKKQLTIKELAMKLFEKESVMHRIESGKFEPRPELIKKMENLFGASLRRKVEEAESIEQKKEFKKMTLADLLQKKD